MWRNKTKIEKAAINTLKKGKEIILKNIPKDEIIAIYVGGSFIRREMNEKSDVDLWVIVKDNKLLPKIVKLKKFRKSTNPEIGISGYSLWELKNNKKHIKGKKFRPNPDRFIKYLPYYKLVYGKKINYKNLPISSDKKNLINFIKVFEKTFIPLYKNKKFGFQDIIKQIFFLTDQELRVQGKNPPYEWRKLVILLPKNHITHEALKLRKNRTKDKKIREQFIKKLENHLNYLKNNKTKYF